MRWLGFGVMIGGSMAAGFYGSTDFVWGFMAGVIVSGLYHISEIYSRGR